MNLALFTLKLLRWLGLAAAFALLSGCFLTSALPQDKKSKPTHTTTPEVPPVAAPPVKPSVLSPQRLARRLAIDLALRLPAPTDLAALELDPKSFDKFVDAYLQGADASRALAGLHTRMWHLDSKRLPDLDGFVAGGDSALGTELTPAVRQHLVEEPALHVRLAIERGTPFKDLFSSAFTVAHEDTLALLGLTDDGTPWLGEPYRYATYADGRPAAGALATNGLLAAFGSGGDKALRARTNRLLGELTCLNNEDAQAHLFYKLTSEELASDLNALASTKSPCLGCHASFESTGAAFAGLGSGASLTAWQTYVAPTTEPAGNYAGFAFEGLEGLATQVANDPRTHRCEIQKLISAIYQRPVGAFEVQNAPLAIDDFYRGNQSLVAAARRIVLSPEYAYDKIGSTVTGDYPRNSTGVRILTQNQWRGLMEDLLPGNTLTFPDELDAGYDETATSDSRVPTGLYFHAVERLARQAAAAIVDAELADGVQSASRRLLTGLPDGNGVGVSSVIVFAQMRATWKRLTGETLDDANPTYLDLMTLWSTAKADATADDFRRGWRTVLVAMLTHPSFIGY